MGEKAWACPDRHMWVGAGRVWRHGWVHAGYNCEHKKKEKKETLTYWHRQAGIGTGRQVGIGKSGHGARKCGHAQTGACRWVQGGMWRHRWVHAGYNCEHKQKEKKRKTYLLAQAGRCGHRQVGGHA